MVNQIILFHNYILNLDIPSEKKSDILCKLADIDQNLIKGCDEFIQFMKLIMREEFKQFPIIFRDTQFIGGYKECMNEVYRICFDMEDNF